MSESQQQPAPQGITEPTGPSHALPYCQAFVVQFRALRGSERLAGRVEHVASGRGQSFESFEELRAFCGATLRALEPDA